LTGKSGFGSEAVGIEEARMDAINQTPLALSADSLGKALVALCDVDTTSGREDALLPSLRGLLETLGAEIHLQRVSEGRTNVLATWGRPRVLFSTHLDTVPPYIPPVLDGGILRGRGACDAKGQIIAQLGAIRQLLSEGHDGLAWLGVVSEETDSVGATAALDLAHLLPDLKVVVNGEPTELKLGTGQRGILHLRLRTEGRAAHSSLAHLGKNALWPMLTWIERLRALPLPVDPDLGPLFWNLGRLEAGEAVNSVPAMAEAHILARVVPGSDFEAQVRELAPPEGSVDVLLQEPWDFYPRIPGFEYAPMPFGSDLPQLRALVPDRTAVLVGPGSIERAHALDEQITLEELVMGARLNAHLAKTFLGSSGK
jgi:acetylornithine deacetylase